MTRRESLIVQPESSSVSELGQKPAEVRAPLRCGFGHSFGRKRAAIGYYDIPHDVMTWKRTFVCRKHARQAERVGHHVERNGGYWPGEEPS